MLFEHSVSAAKSSNTILAQVSYYPCIQTTASTRTHSYLEGEGGAGG